MTTGTYLYIFKAGQYTKAIPTTKKFCNARVLDVLTLGSFTAHWISNYNKNGDFATELMRFNSYGILDTKDKNERNEVRKANELHPIN